MTLTVNQTAGETRPKPRREERELPEYSAMMRRMLRAYGRRCADADPEDLAIMLTMRAELDAAIQSAVDGMRERNGFSWTEVARGAGITRQGAQQRWGGKRVES